MKKTVWLSQSQMTELFGVDRTVITRHVNVNRETEKDILEHLEAQPNKQGYIKELIKQDMRTKKE